MAGSDFHSSPAPRLQRWGEGLRSIINGQPPGTDFDWSDRIAKMPRGAVVSHEIGQWTIFPDLDEVSKYRGVLEPRNFELVRQGLADHHLLDQAQDPGIVGVGTQKAKRLVKAKHRSRSAKPSALELVKQRQLLLRGSGRVGVLERF